VEAHVGDGRDLAGDRLRVVRPIGDPSGPSRVQAVPGQVDRDGGAARGGQVGDDLAPAPRPVPEAMNENQHETSHYGCYRISVIVVTWLIGKRYAGASSTPRPSCCARRAARA